jgi:hypothetical protein
MLPLHPPTCFPYLLLASPQPTFTPLRDALSQPRTHLSPSRPLPTDHVWFEMLFASFLSRRRLTQGKKGIGEHVHATPHAAPLSSGFGLVFQYFFAIAGARSTRGGTRQVSHPFARSPPARANPPVARFNKNAPFKRLGRGLPRCETMDVLGQANPTGRTQAKATASC